MGLPTPSQRFQLNSADMKKWTYNLVAFLAPLGVIYFGAIAVTLQAPGHVFTIKDFAPTTFTQGAVVLYLADRLFDISRKFVAPK